TITLIEQGNPLGNDLRGHFQREELVRWATTNDDGHYELRAGPGRYTLRGPEPAEFVDLVLACDEEELIRDFHLPALARTVLRGAVHRGKKPLANAIVRGESAVSGGAGFNTVTDIGGCFTCERWRARMIVYARSQDGVEAGCTEVAEQDETV